MQRTHYIIWYIQPEITVATARGEMNRAQDRLIIDGQLQTINVQHRKFRNVACPKRDIYRERVKLGAEPFRVKLWLFDSLFQTTTLIVCHTFAC